MADESSAQHGMVSMIETPRLSITPLIDADASFILNLLNQPSFIDNIADKGVKNLQDAQDYIKDGPQASYTAHGIGLWKVSLRETNQPIGMAGLLQRDYLPVPDLGYALLPEFTGRGFAHEATAAVLAWAKTNGYQHILAICNPENKASDGLLIKLGFADDGPIVPPGETQPIKRYKKTLV